MLVGVLALQGAFREHMEKLEGCGAQGREIRKPHELEGVEALIIPGGESTTIGRLMVEFDLMEPIRRLGEEGMPIWGTCAGMVLLAKDIIDSQQPRLALIDMKVRRNAFGRQVDSFELDLTIPLLGEKPFRGVFIRAPYAEEVHPGVEVLATVDGKVVAVRQGKLLATAFHPELTGDVRFHRYFLNTVAS